RIKGSRAFVQNLDFNKEKVIVDLRDYPYNQETFAVTFERSMVRLPFGVEVLELTPKQVVLSLEREIRKKIPVRVRTVGEVGKDLKLVSKEYSPREFMIRGPYSILKKTTILNTIPIDLSVLEGSGELQLPLEKMDSRILVEEKRNVELSYVIKPNKANLTLKNVDIRFLTKHSKFTTSTDKVSMDVLVSEERKDALRSSEVSVIADIPDNASGNVKVKLRAQLPDGVNLLQIHPEFINVSLQ
ncbi:MAG: CdaR family protein, partial [Halobacteriovoraceae bacterium]|nr:CdaR family protein [Halobacteriovoraceae bacterium]